MRILQRRRPEQRVWLDRYLGVLGLGLLVVLMVISSVFGILEFSRASDASRSNRQILIELRQQQQRNADTTRKVVAELIAEGQGRTRRAVDELLAAINAHDAEMRREHHVPPGSAPSRTPSPEPRPTPTPSATPSICIPVPAP